MIYGNCPDHPERALKLVEVGNGKSILICEQCEASKLARLDSLFSPSTTRGVK